MRTVTLDEAQQDYFDEMTFLLRCAKRDLESSDPAVHIAHVTTDVQRACHIAAYFNDVFDLQRKISA